MKGKKICTLLAGIINLLYAVILAGGIVLGVILGIGLLFGINTADNSLGGALAAVFGVLLLGVVIIGLIIAIPPFVCTLISSIGLIKRAVKDKRPKGPAILSIVIHSLVIIGYFVGIIACFASGETWAAYLIAIGLLLSVANIVLCGIGMSGWKEEQPAEQEEPAPEQ